MCPQRSRWLLRLLISVLSIGITESAAASGVPEMGARFAVGPQRGLSMQRRDLPGCAKPNDLRVEQHYGAAAFAIDRDTVLCRKRVYRKPFVVRASNVTLDCAGATVQGPGNRRQHGIRIQPNKGAVSNITVKNCLIRGWERGINAEAPYREAEPSLHNVRLLDNHIYNNHGEGVFLRAHHSLLQNLRVERNRLGLYLQWGSHDNEVAHSTFSFSKAFPKRGKLSAKGGREGIAIDGAYHNKIYNNRIENNATQGIALYTNCGERGKPRTTIAHSNEIQRNLIRGHLFLGSGPALGSIRFGAGVVIAARQGLPLPRMTCSNPGVAIAGATSPPRYRDFAPNTQIEDNVIYNNQFGVVVADSNARVSHNTFSPSHGNDRADIIIGSQVLDRHNSVSKVSGVRALMNRFATSKAPGAYRQLATAGSICEVQVSPGSQLRVAPENYAPL